MLGREETDVLEPAVARSVKAGIDVSGPFPGDTIFLRAMRGEFDAVIACYHDQGLIPIKMAAFGQAVNVTLGLPIIRTSVDHGTAFDIAGKDIADPESMVQAVLLARCDSADSCATIGSGGHEWLKKPSAKPRRRTSPRTARRSTTTTCSRRSRPASRCSAPR